MTIPLDYLFAAVFILCVALATAGQTYTFGRWWRNNELARRFMGIATIMLLALILVVSGILSFDAWLMLMAAFAVAGAVRGYRDINDSNKKRELRTQQQRERIDDATN